MKAYQASKFPRSCALHSFLFFSLPPLSLFAITRLRSANKSGPVSIYNLTVSSPFSSFSLSLSGTRMQPTTGLRFGRRVYRPIFVIIEQPRVPLARWPSVHGGGRTREREKRRGERRIARMSTTDQLNILRRLCLSNR